jgi:SAM-dependent MidA family methyltransferase
MDSGGPLTFARFMERALYEPGLGYYATSSDRATRTGDFLTAPELHPIFGAALARQVEEMWRRLGRPADFTLRDYGAGRATLGTDVGAGLTADASPLAEVLRYEPIEIEGRLPVVARPPTRMVGCVVANEFADALPVHRVIMRRGKLREAYVDWSDGRFIDVEGDPSDPELERWFDARQITLDEGQQAEVNLGLRAWAGELAATVERGYVLILDYALEPAALYGPERASGTLRAFAGHHVSGDVLSGVGRRDITATVDIDVLEREARAAGFDVAGRTTQAEFLMGCGLEEVLGREQERAGQDAEAWLLLRSSVARLLDPRQLGGYAVLVLSRDVDPPGPLRGLEFHLPRRG